jgi:PAT family beta-lactamase induction signal transducer AmpG
MTTLAFRAWHGPAISESRALRLGMVFLLYVAQGIPLGLFYIALPAWMAANGVGAGGVGTMLAATTLPWTLKFFNGFIMERYPYLPMGRRRAWLMAAQAVIVAGLVAMAVANPAASDVVLLSIFAFLINIATSFQDVAIDGMAVDLVPDAERAHANGLMFGGQAIGMAASGAAAGIGIALIGLPGVLLLAALLVAILVLCIALCRERPGERLLPWTNGAPSAHSLDAHLGAWIPVLKATWAAMLDRRSLMTLPVILAIGLHGGLYSGNLPLVAAGTAGWPQDRISNLAATGSLIAGLLAAVVFGLVVAGLGVRRSMQVGCGLILLTTIGALAVQGAWVQGWPIGGLLLISDPINFFLSVAMGTAAMRLCQPAVAATQFTLYMAICNLGRTLGSGLLGPLDRLGGDFAMIGAMAVVGLFGLLAARWISD